MSRSSAQTFRNWPDAGPARHQRRTADLAVAGLNPVLSGVAGSPVVLRSVPGRPFGIHGPSERITDGPRFARRQRPRPIAAADRALRPESGANCPAPADHASVAKSAFHRKGIPESAGLTMRSGEYAAWTTCRPPARRTSPGPPAALASRHRACIARTRPGASIRAPDTVRPSGARYGGVKGGRRGRRCPHGAVRGARQWTVGAPGQPRRKAVTLACIPLACRAGRAPGNQVRSHHRVQHHTVGPRRERLA